MARRDVTQFSSNIRGSAVGPDDKARMGRLLCLVEDAVGFHYSLS